jgi:NTE family protein
MRKSVFFILTVLLGISVSVFSQQPKVGLVLSGGGANATAHIGVIKFLEEHNIPIDYITGTSMGALIGAMYASGYSIKEIEQYFTSDKFKKVATGAIVEEIKPFYKLPEPSPAFFTFKISKDTLIQTSLPTNFVNSSGIDFELLRFFAQPKAACRNNFDSLMIPFRCVAADISNHSPVIFKNGELDKAIRASMAYPFYIKAIKYNNMLLMDGGIFNNFPLDVMLRDFKPDVVIGVNVSDEFEHPDENDIISQIKNLIVARNQQHFPAEKGVLIEPETPFSTFDFHQIPGIINIGYQAAQQHKYEILEKIKSRHSSEQIKQKRMDFKRRFPPLLIKDFEIKGLTRLQSRYVKSIMRLQHISEPLTLSDLEKRFYRLLSDDKIREIEPSLIYNNDLKGYKLILDIEKEKDIFIDFGGNLSSIGVNQGFIGMQYNYIGRTAGTFRGNANFGKFNTSFLLSARWDFPFKTPFYVKSEGILNAFNFFTYNRQYGTENVKPTFVKTNHKFGVIELGTPLSKNAVLKLHYEFGTNQLEYFNTPLYTSADTADITYIDFIQPCLTIEHNTLNYKQFADKGTFWNISIGYSKAYEYNEPGTTSKHIISFFEDRQWLKLKGTLESYYLSNHKIKTGTKLNFTFSNMPVLRNYYSTLLQAEAFHPTIESKLLFIEQYRTFSYAAIRQPVIYTPFKKFQIRITPGVFIPYQEIKTNDYYDVYLTSPLSSLYFTFSSTILYHTPVGPLSLSYNYYQNTDIAGLNLTPSTIFFNFGYIIFNKTPY